MDNPFLRRANKGSNNLSAAHKRSAKQEQSLSKRLGGYRTGASGLSRTDSASGRDRPHKSDVNVKGVARIEAKTTSARSFSVTREMIDKVSNASAGIDVVPAIVVEFLNSAGAPECEVAVIPMHALERLIADASRNQT